MADDEELGWDGPQIRPMQQSRPPKNRGSDKQDRHRDRSSGSHSRREDSIKRKSEQGRRDQFPSHRNDRPHTSDRGRDRPSSQRDRSRPEPDRSRASSDRHRDGGHSSSRRNDPQMQERKKDKKGSQDRHAEDKLTREAEIRKALEDVEKKMRERKEREKAKKREHTSEKKETVPKKAKVEEISVKKPDQESDDTKSEGETSGSGSSSAESGSEESEESSSSEESSDDTGSEQAEDTPEEVEDEEEEEEEVEEEEEEVEELSVEPEKSKKGSEKKKSPVESIHSGSNRSVSRTPSRSPTPRRMSNEESNSRFDRDDSTSPRSQRSSEHDNQENRDPEVLDIEDPPSPVQDELPPYLPSVNGCRNVNEFKCLNRIEEGTYGIVFRAKDLRTNEIVALKRLKMENEKEGFPITSLREINTLLVSQHPNVVTVREIVVGSNMDQIFIVMDFVEHDLKALMETMRSKKQIFLPGEIKCLMQQLLRAVAYLHDNWVLHRDLKTSNLLLSHNGILKVGDFGLAREYGSPLKAYTSVVVTLWYRAPELLLGIKEYSTHIDVWSIGCIFGELLLMEPLLPGKSEMEQLAQIFNLLGTPTEKIYPGLSKLPVVQKTTLPEYQPTNLRSKFPKEMLTDLGITLFKQFLTYDPKKRITCEEALASDYFQETPRAIHPSMFPTWPAKSESSGRRGANKAGASPKPPSGGGAFKKIGNDDDKYSGFVLKSGPAGPPQWNIKF